MTLPQTSEFIPFWAVHRHATIPQKPRFLLAVFPACDIHTGIDGARGYVCVVHRLRLTLCHLLAAWECQGASGHSPAHHWFACFPSCPCVLSLPLTKARGRGLSRSPPRSLSLISSPSRGEHRMLMWQRHNSSRPPSVECVCCHPAVTFDCLQVL